MNIGQSCPNSGASNCINAGLMLLITAVDLLTAFALYSLGLRDAGIHTNKLYYHDYSCVIVLSVATISPNKKDKSAHHKLQGFQAATNRIKQTD